MNNYPKRQLYNLIQIGSKVKIDPEYIVEHLCSGLSDQDQNLLVSKFWTLVRKDINLFYIDLEGLGNPSWILRINPYLGSYYSRAVSIKTYISNAN